MNTFRNIFAAVALFLFVGLAVPSMAMADENGDEEIDALRLIDVPYCISGGLIVPSCQ